MFIVFWPDERDLTTTSQSSGHHFNLYDRQNVRAGPGSRYPSVRIARCKFNENSANLLSGC